MLSIPACILVEAPVPPPARPPSAATRLSRMVLREWYRRQRGSWWSFSQHRIFTPEDPGKKRHCKVSERGRESSGIFFFKLLGGDISPSEGQLVIRNVRDRGDGFDSEPCEDRRKSILFEDGRKYQSINYRRNV